MPMVGREQAAAPGLNRFERLYIRAFGYPALGLRVRAKPSLILRQQVTSAEQLRGSR